MQSFYFLCLKISSIYKLNIDVREIRMNVDSKTKVTFFPRSIEFLFFVFSSGRRNYQLYKIHFVFFSHILIVNQSTSGTPFAIIYLSS